jgi:virulence-associated protein VapD
MAVTTAQGTRSGSLRPGLPASFKRDGTVYAIAFDMDIEQLQIHYGDPYNNAYLDIRRVLERHHFQWQQGSVYFGDASVTAATVTVAVIDLTTQLPWFAASVRDIRMLRIEELNDLMPVVQRVAGMSNGESGSS